MAVLAEEAVLAAGKEKAGPVQTVWIMMATRQSIAVILTASAIEPAGNQNRTIKLLQPPSGIVFMPNPAPG